MIHLWQNWFISNNELRQKEYLFCFDKNILNKYINKIHLLGFAEDLKHLNNSKIEKHAINNRAKYDSFFYLINKYSHNDHINVIANLDIYFDESIEKAKVILTEKRVLALTRWNVGKDKNIDFYNREDSQDCWMFLGKTKKINGDFELGQMGCDNRIAHELIQSEYTVFNPSKTIKCYHLHNTNIRSYDHSTKIKPPYKMLKPL